MKTHRTEEIRRLIVFGGMALLGFALRPAALAGEAAATVTADHPAGVLEFETQSEYSRIRIRKRGDVRTLLFVRDNGYEAVQSQLDLREPQVPRFDYMKFFAASFLLVPRPKAVLIVGLGGGGMVHFLRRVSPDLQIDAVEIDPVVARLAEQYFGVRPDGRTRIIVGDGLKYLAETQNRYDVIYLDAYLKPSAETDAEGAPRSLRTQQFYKSVQSKLSPHGLVAFNLNNHSGLVDDIRNIVATFPQIYAFPLAGEAVVLGSTDAARVSAGEFERRADELDRTEVPFMNFRELLLRLHR